MTNQSMIYSLSQMILIFVISLFSRFDLAYPHLKNLGETENWSEEMMIVSVVAGGVRTTLSKYPFNVKFLNLGNMCGGIIITAKNVLTAAHCFDASDNIDGMKVIANSDSIFTYGAIFHDVWHYIIHEKYGIGATYANDIAVIIIHGQFVYGEKVQKAILIHNDAWMSEEERKFTVAGWGDTENSGESNYLTMREADLRYISSENCSKMSQSVLTPDMFCLYGDGERDTGRGDSGGGVLWHDQIVGITSHGKNIDVPGIYANVFYFLPWIENVTLKLYNQYCDFHKKTLPEHVGRTYRSYIRKL